VTLIKEKIKNTFDIVEEIKSKNNELFIVISQDVKLFKDTKSMTQVVQEFKIETQHSNEDGNKVIRIKEIPGEFNSSLVHEKTSGVISRVYEMFTNIPVKVSKHNIVPELLIEKGDTFADKSLSEETIQNGNSNTSLNEKKNIDDELFTELSPFKETILFTNKTDDVFSPVEVSKDREVNAVMPELFFGDNEVQFNNDKEENSNDEVLSFDEQIQALLDDDTSKVKKLVA